MSEPQAVPSDQFSETVFEFADEVGPEPIWDLLVSPPVELPAAARDQADERLAWHQFADFLERAIRHTSPIYVWKQLRTTIRVYEAYGVDEMSVGERRRLETAEEEDRKLEAPTPMEAQYIECPSCGNVEFLVVVFRPPAVLGRCANCDCEIWSLHEVTAEETSSEIVNLLVERTDVLESLERTRKAIEELEEDGRFENVLKLIPLYRLEAQHMRAVRKLTTRLAEVMGDETGASACS